MLRKSSAYICSEILSLTGFRMLPYITIQILLSYEFHKELTSHFHAETLFLQGA